MLQKRLKVVGDPLRALPAGTMSRLGIDDQPGTSYRRHEAVLISTRKQGVVFTPDQEGRCGDVRELFRVVVGEQVVEHITPQAGR